MKKFLIMAAAALAFFGCTEPKTPDDKPKADEITLSASDKTFDNLGGSLSVIVTSSTDWNLTSAEDYNWVSPSAISGVDGDVVKFTVEPNNTQEELVAKFTFTAGEAHADLTIKSLAKELASLDVAEKDVVLGYESGEINVIVTSEVEYRNLVATVSEDAPWLKHVVNLQGDEAGTSKMVFSYEALEGLDDRSAVITVSAADAQSVEVNVLQEAKHVLYTDKVNYTAAVAGETINIPLVANVEYKIEIAQEGDWLSYGEATAEGIPFTAKALSDGKRAATVTFTQTDAKEGEETLVHEITITQVNAIITWAAEMTGNRLFPKWDGIGPKLGVAHAVTLEALINVDEFHKEINTLMGIEGMFLLRFGDAGVDPHILQVATFNGNFAMDTFAFETNKWYHIACTYDMADNYMATVKIYVNGELKGEKTGWPMSKYVGWPINGYVNGVDFSPAWSYEPNGNRCFWMGYSYDANRDLRGKMTEIRIWNKVLTAEEINAENHFYEVDPNSEGLYSYWKFTAGSGNYVEDATSNGNKLYGELNVRKQGSDNIGDEGINWVEVSLPDK